MAYTLTDADYTAIGARKLMDQGYTNLAVASPWGANPDASKLAQYGREHVASRLAGAPGAPWEENLQGRLFLAGVRDGVNTHQAADTFAMQHGFASAQFHDQMTGGNLVQQFESLVPRLPHPDASNQALGPNLGGEDAIQDPPGGAPPASSPAMGLGGVVLLAGGLALLAILLGRRNK